MTDQQLGQLLNNAIVAALKAGQEISKIYETDDFNVEMKSDNSPLTKADKASHKIITDYLTQNSTIRQFANSSIPILSEEGKDIPYNERKDWKLYWLIDPLDGTKEFIKRNGEFTVNIALIENDEPILGVIYAPEYESKIKDKSKKDKDQIVILNESEESLVKILDPLEKFKGTLYAAATGLGAYKAYYVEDKLNVKQLNAQRLMHNAHSKTAVGSRSHSSEEEKQKLGELGVTEIISVGSSLKFCMVTEGKAQVYYRLGPTMEWDVAAGYSIAKEAGAKIEGLTFNKENLLNSSFLVSI